MNAGWPQEIDAGTSRLARARSSSAGSARRGELEIREFVEREYAQVVATVRLVCGSAAVAEDAVQEALAGPGSSTGADVISIGSGRG